MNTALFTKYTVFNCGWAVFHDPLYVTKLLNAGYKVHRIMGRDVAVLLFGHGI
jgi:hypothetical protein